MDINPHEKRKLSIINLEIAPQKYELPCMLIIETLW
jgi:hypothetical protein